MLEAILTLNGGSSSVKFALYGAESLQLLCRGKIDGVGGRPQFIASGQLAPAFAGEHPPHAGGHELLGWLLATIRGRLDDVTIVAAGHRVVHGGARFDAPVRINEDVLCELERLIEFAPLHEPYNLAAIRAVAGVWPELPQVACFDTDFHRTQPRLAQMFALPFELTEKGILRYGFHGLSYEYIASVLPKFAGERAEGKVIVAHLGNGASMCAMEHRRSLATTMGFTALDGLMMGTRTGALDPGVVLALLQQKGMSAAEVQELLYHKSGLLGVSGISSDVRELEASLEPRAREALELFCYRAARELGSLVAVMGGLDVLVFTAGIGENSAGIRKRICDLTGWAGVDMDATANEAARSKISSMNSAVDVFVIPTDEELVIAHSTQSTLHGSAPGDIGF